MSAVRHHKDLDLYQIQESGFASSCAGGPGPDNAADWVAWHFTHIDNIASIAQTGLQCDRAIAPTTSHTNADIKANRARTQIPGQTDDLTVGDFVPFYFAPRSPTSFRVLNDYQNPCPPGELAFLGLRLGDIADLVPWWVTDGNAVEGMTVFTNDIDTVGNHVDRNVLSLRFWNDRTGEDLDRGRRRHAELLVRNVPASSIGYVACYSAAALERVTGLFTTVGGDRHYGVDTNMYALKGR